MSEGKRGWDVAALQFLLHERGFEPGGFDGGFGPNTANAVRRFQAAAHVSVDGIAGLGDDRGPARNPGGRDVAHRARALLPAGPRSDRRPVRLDPARALAHRPRLPGADGDPHPCRRGWGGLVRRLQYGRLRQPGGDHAQARFRKLVRAHVEDRRVGGAARRRAVRRSATSDRPGIRQARTCTSRFVTSAPRSTPLRTSSVIGRREPLTAKRGRRQKCRPNADARGRRADPLTARLDRCP